MDHLPIPGHGGAVDGRAHQGMPEPGPAPELDQPDRLGHGGRVGAQP